MSARIFDEILPAHGQWSAGKIILLPDLGPAEEFHVVR
jgi:hypothetical protein